MYSKYKKVYGLIGKDLSHSFSKKYFSHKFQALGIKDEFYDLFSLEDVKNFLELFNSHTNLIGLNVTIPYKEAVIPFLDELDEDAKQIGAINTITNTNGVLKGYNTDVIGFSISLAKLIKGKRIDCAYVLGTGGASKAVKFVLEKNNILYKVISRKKSENSLQYKELPVVFNKELNNLIINTTPVGTLGFKDKLLPLPYEKFSNKSFLFDLVYNPKITPFLQKGIDNNCNIINGYDMLVGQAEASYKLWLEI